MKKSLIFFTTFIFIALMAGMAIATPEVDQTNLYTGGTASGPSVSSGYFLAQTITNGITGRLAVLELNVTKHASTTLPLIVQIRVCVNNEPSDEVLIEKVINPSDVNTAPGTSKLSIDFSQDNLFFNSGDVFSIVLHSENEIVNEFNWWMPSGKDYTGGNAYRSLDKGVSWNFIIAENIYDFGFQTFIEPYTEVIFEDNFNSEPNVPWIYNYNNFANWDVIDGAVDLISSSHPGFEAFVFNGMFIDLDGTSYKPGIMQTKTTFTFYPGYTYELFFDLAGSQLPEYTEYDTVTVSLGGIYNENITLHATEPFSTFQHTFTVNDIISTKLTFENWTDVSGEGYYVGLLLDNVAIYIKEILVPIYACTGFEPPCNDMIAVKNKNRCVPLKTELLDTDGLPITDADIVSPPIIDYSYLPKLPSPSDTTVFDGLPPAVATDGNEFVFEDGKWHLNIKIGEYYEGSGTYTFTMKSGDESEYSIESINNTVTIVFDK